MDPAAYKDYHEGFMRNQNGTSPVEVFMNIVPTFSTVFFALNLTVTAQLIQIPAKFLVEFIIIIVSLILSVTILNDHITKISFTLLIVTITAACRQIYRKTHTEPFVMIPARRPHYLNVSRAVINLITAVCILAVDFKSFPRKLAKTEEFGFGLMDTGVGLYVFSNGIISKDVRRPSQFSLKLIQNTLINNSPLLLFGIGRFFVTNEIDYQTHVSEYGVHWNFFITLAITKIFGTILMTIVKTPEHSKYMAIAFATIHEFTLQLGLAKFALGNDIDRTASFLNANREGIISIPGYISLYFASVYIGCILKSDDDTIKVRPMLKDKVLKMVIISVILWKLIYTCDGMFGVSRRLANMGYVIWVLSIGTSMVTLFMLVEIFFHFYAFDKRKPASDDKVEIGMDTFVPTILESINFNGLAFFLGANLLTGLVNLTFQTLLVSPGGCIFILTVYMFVLCACMTFFYVNNIKLKFW